MDRVGDAPVPRNHLAVEAVDQLLVGPVGRMGRVFLGDDQPGTAGGAGGVVGGMLLGRPAPGCVVREMRGEDDAVAHRHRPQIEGRPQESLGHGLKLGTPGEPGEVSRVTPGARTWIGWPDRTAEQVGRTG